MEHPQEDVEDVSQVRIHRSLAIATSSRQPVSSSSSRVRPIRSRSTVRISVFRAPIHEDDEAEAELPLIQRVQGRELDEQARVVRLALFGGRACGQSCALADRRVGCECLDLLVLAQPREDVVCSLEGILDLRELLDQSRATLEELAELVDAQLPR